MSSPSSTPGRFVDRADVAVVCKTFGLTPLAPNNDVGFSSTVTSGFRDGRYTATLSY